VATTKDHPTAARGGGADVNAQGGTCPAALQAASFNGHNLIVQRLLEAGANVNILGGAWSTALHAAWYHGRDQIDRQKAAGGRG